MANTPFGDEYDRIVGLHDTHLANLEAGFAAWQAAINGDWVQLLNVTAAMKKFRFSAGSGPNYDRGPMTPQSGGFMPLVSTAQATEKRLQAIRTTAIVFPEPPTAHYGLPVEPGDLS